MNSSVKNIVILAGGKGTRMRENPQVVPKPMVKIGGVPVLTHITNYFDQFGDFKYIICSGYKEEVLFDYFKNNPNEKIKIISTGTDTQTGGRLISIQEHLESDNFLMTYGDGLADVKIHELLDFHKNNPKIATITVHKPEFRFGVVNFDENNQVESFIEKPTLNHYVNIGFMVLNKKVFDYIDTDMPFENEPLVNLAKNNELGAFKHHGFFRPMDTYREYLELNELWEENKAPWKPRLVE
tara:strand:- start:5761 stop:6480 length:720 start_codon:yes stop_codon:yes gene_type:complete